jgi:hypothetical protein
MSEFCLYIAAQAVFYAQKELKEIKSEAPVARYNLPTDLVENVAPVKKMDRFSPIPLFI